MDSHSLPDGLATSDLPLGPAVERFLACSRIAVAGVSRHGDQPANLIFRKLRTAGHLVFPVNPAADEVEDTRCYADLAEIPGGVEALVIAAPPAAAIELVERCAELGIGHIWMHRSVDGGSYSPEAVELCHREGIEVIPGACPMMFVKPVDPAHWCIKWGMRLFGKMPKTVAGSLPEG